MSGIGYSYQNAQVLIGSKSNTVVRGVALTSSYQAEGSGKPTKSFVTAGLVKVEVSGKYTTGASETATSIDIKVESSPDRVNWYRILNLSISGGTSTLTNEEFVFAGGAGATDYPISLPLDVQNRYLRISTKETGVSVNAGSVYVEVMLSGAK